MKALPKGRPDSIAPPDEADSRERLIRDLVALSALPSIWVDCDLQRSLQNITDVLKSATKAVAVCVRIDWQDGVRFETGSSPGLDNSGMHPDVLQDLLAYVEPQSQTVVQLPSFRGEGPLDVFPYPIVWEGRRIGHFAAVFKPDLGPSESEQLIFHVAGNQVRLLLQRHKSEQEKAAREAAEERLQDTLRIRESRMLQLVSLMPTAVYTCDEQGRISFFNKRAAELWGREPKLGDNDEKFCGAFRLCLPDGALLPEDQTPMALAVRDGISTRNREVVIERHDGSRVTVSINIEPLYDTKGARCGAINVFQDITAHKRAEEALSESERRLRATFNQAAVGIAVADLNGRFIEVNQKFSEILGYAPAQLYTMCVLELTHPEDLAQTRDNMQRLLAGQISDYAYEKRFLRKDKSEVWCLTTVTIVKDQAGQPHRFIGVIEDITPRRRAEETLRQRTRSLEIINRIGDTLAAELDLEKLVQSVTDAGTEVTGAQFGAFFYNLVDEKGESYTLYTVSGVPRDAFSKFPMPRNTPVFAPTFRGEGIVRIGDVRRDPRYGTMEPHHGMPPGHLPVRSYLAAPVISRSGKVLGGLFFGHSEPHVFTEEAEKVISGIAGQAAIAIDNARLYRAAQMEIGQRKLAEETVSEMNLALTHAMPGISILDTQGRYLKVNKAYAHMLGYEPSEMIGMAWTPTIHPRERDTAQAAYRSMLDKGSSEFEATAVRKDGSEFFKQVMMVNRLDRDGRTSGHYCFTKDISDRKRAEEALRESEERFQAILENSATVIYAKDTEGRYLLINELFEELFHVTRDEIVGKTDFDLFPELLARKFRENDLAVIRSGNPLEIEEIAPHDDGPHTYISIKFPLRKVDGTIYAVTGISTDITGRKRAEEALQRLAAIVESSDDAIISKGINGVITSWNIGAERMFGYTAEEAVGKPVTLVIPTERHTEELAILARIRNAEFIGRYETVRTRKDGTLVDVSLTVSPIKDSSGTIIGASTIVHDITERKRVEVQQRSLYELVAAVNRAESLTEIFEEALNCICECQNVDRASILLYDETGAMRFKAWRGLSDSYRSAVEGHSPWTPDDPDPKPVLIEDVAAVALKDHLRAVITKEGIRALAFIPLTYEKRLLGKFMIYYNHPHTFTPAEIRPAQTVASQVAFALERRKLSESLERLVGERTASLHEAVAQMEEFSYTVSHDLRAPLRGMQVYSKALLEDFKDTLAPEAGHYLNRIAENANRLDKMILDVLTFSRIARAELRLERVTLDRLVRQIVEQYPGMQTPHAQIEIEPLADVMGHEPSLTQAIANLLNNAVKFVAPSTIPKVRVRSERHNGHVRLWVEDNGIGIDPRHQHRLFKMFERAHPNLKYEGTGVGLAIVRKAVERMGGRVGMESDGVKGSRFWIEIRATDENK